MIIILKVVFTRTKISTGTNSGLHIGKLYTTEIWIGFAKESNYSIQNFRYNFFSLNTILIPQKNVGSIAPEYFGQHIERKKEAPVIIVIGAAYFLWYFSVPIDNQSFHKPFHCQKTNHPCQAFFKLDGHFIPRIRYYEKKGTVRFSSMIRHLSTPTLQRI